MENNNRNDRDMSLMDYLYIVKKRKYVPVFVVLLSVTATLLISVLLPKQYMAEAVVKIGREFVLLKSDAVIEKVIEDFREANKLAELQNLLHKDDESLAEGIIDVISSGLLIKGAMRITVTLEDRLLCQDLCASLVRHLVEHANFNTNKTKVLINDQLDLCRSNLNQIGENLRVYSVLLKDFEKGGYPSMERLFKTQDMVVNLQLKQMSLRTRQSQLEKSLLDLREYAVLSQPRVPRNPLKPNIWMNVLVSCFVSLFLAIGWVFFFEAATTYKKRLGGSE